MTAQQAIERLSELAPKEPLAIAWFGQAHFGVEHDKWLATVRFTDTMYWECMTDKIQQYINTSNQQ